MSAKRAQGRPAKERDFTKEAQVAEDYRSGLGVADLMRKHGIRSTSKVYSILSLMHVPLRAQGANQGAA